MFIFSGSPDASPPSQALEAIPVITPPRHSSEAGSSLSSEISLAVESNQAGSSTSSLPLEAKQNDLVRTTSSASVPAPTTEPALPSNLKRQDCGICSDEVLYAHVPRWGPFAITASERRKGATGMIMHCGYEHIYCFSCLSTYLRTKLEEAGKKSVFPIPCPGSTCAWWVREDEVKIVLSQSEMETMWYWAKLFDDVPTFYCPIGTCGTRVALPDPECRGKLRQAECPACKETFCFKCQAKWHEGQSCAKYARASGALAQDKALQKLAKQFKWRRCPKCRIVVERSYGCRHMSCRCGHQFCYNCGRTWGIGCGGFRSLFCFPTKFEIWPETRSLVTEYLRDIFGMNRGLVAATSVANRPA